MPAELKEKQIASFCVSVMQHELFEYAKLFFGWMAQREKSMSEYFDNIEQMLSSAFKGAKKACIIEIPLEMSADDVGNALCQIIL